jgi:hypothetical protein
MAESTERSHLDRLYRLKMTKNMLIGKGIAMDSSSIMVIFNIIDSLSTEGSMSRGSFCIAASKELRWDNATSVHVFTSFD